MAEELDLSSFQSLAEGWTPEDTWAPATVEPRQQALALLSQTSGTRLPLSAAEHEALVSILAPQGLLDWIEDALAWEYLRMVFEQEEFRKEAEKHFQFVEYHEGFEAEIMTMLPVPWELIRNALTEMCAQGLSQARRLLSQHASTPSDKTGGALRDLRHLGQLFSRWLCPMIQRIMILRRRLEALLASSNSQKEK